MADASAGFSSGIPFFFLDFYDIHALLTSLTAPSSIKALSSLPPSSNYEIFLLLYGFLLNYLLFSFYILFFWQEAKLIYFHCFNYSPWAQITHPNCHISMTLRISNVSYSTLVIFNPELSSYPDSLLYEFLLKIWVNIRNFIYLVSQTRGPQLFSSTPPYSTG